VGGRVGPVSADHAPVPAQQRLWLHQEHRPTCPWEHPAERRKQRTVLWLQAGPWMLAAQHRKLVAQYQNLDFLGLCRAEAEQDQLEAAAQRQVDERPDHTRPPPTKASKRRRIVALHQAVLAGDGHNRLLAPHGSKSPGPVRCRPALTHAAWCQQVTLL
jgi:hypothetical protein